MAERIEKDEREMRRRTTETIRTEPDVGERTTRAGAAVEPTTRPIVTERPVTGVVTPTMTTAETVRHARDQAVHPDWETQPQINAPQDVGVPTPEGQADAARIRAGERRSDVSEEPRIDRRGGDVDVPLASGARVTTTEPRDDRTITEKARDKAREIKEDVDRKI